MSSCKKGSDQNPMNDSFLPMQIGNYWWMSASSYTEIQDTLHINGKLYYKFYSLIGGDAMSTTYLRIDEQNKLIEAYLDQPLKTYTRADFNAKIGDRFFTLGDQTVNDYQVTVVAKSNSEMIFEFDMVYHPNLNGNTFKVGYLKGKGWAEKWKKIKINGLVYEN